ncbi:MAG TPA: alpha/beta hydrolase [Polyangiaceae bacterium]|nr:alpha/beta hydrolase [Polyangiaceae bacterium]
MNAKAVPEGKYAEVGDGLRVHYQELGEGPALVFLHGSGPGASGFSNFKRNYPYFAERGFRTLMPDTLGFGYSSKPGDIDYGLDFLVGKLAKFLSGAGVTRAAVVGNSHGGALAIQLALTHPELVDKLVLMAPGGLEERETYMKMDGIRTMMSVFLSKEGITREGMRKVFGLQLYDPRMLTDEIVEERFQIAEHQPKRVLTTLNVPHLTPRLGELGCPIFALWGMNDKFCPVSGAMRIAAACKRSRVMLLSECGHWVMVEYADLFNRLTLDFLREQ